MGFSSKTKKIPSKKIRYTLYFILILFSVPAIIYLKVHYTKPVSIKDEAQCLTLEHYLTELKMKENNKNSVEYKSAFIMFESLLNKQYEPIYLKYCPEYYHKALKYEKENKEVIGYEQVKNSL